MEKFLEQELRGVKNTGIEDITNSLELLRSKHIYLVYRVENDVWVPHLVDDIDVVRGLTVGYSFLNCVVFSRYDLFPSLKDILLLLHFSGTKHRYFAMCRVDDEDKMFLLDTGSPVSLMFVKKERLAEHAEEYHPALGNIHLDLLPTTVLISEPGKSQHRHSLLLVAARDQSESDLKNREGTLIDGKWRGWDGLMGQNILQWCAITFMGRSGMLMMGGRV